MGLLIANRQIGHMSPESKNEQLFVPSAASSAISLTLKVFCAPVSLEMFLDPFGLPRYFSGGSSAVLASLFFRQLPVDRSTLASLFPGGMQGNSED